MILRWHRNILQFRIGDVNLVAIFHFFSIVDQPFPTKKVPWLEIFQPFWGELTAGDRFVALLGMIDDDSKHQWMDCLTNKNWYVLGTFSQYSDMGFAWEWGMYDQFPLSLQ